MQLKVCELFISWIFHLTFSNWGCLWVTETSYSGTVDGGQGETIVVKGCFCSVTNWCSTLRDPIDCNMPGSLVLHYFPEFAQTQGHWFSNAIQPSHPLFLPFPLALNVSQHQSLFQWVISLQQVAKVLELQLYHQSFQWIFRVDFFWNWLVWSPCSRRDSQEYSLVPQFENIFGLQPSFLVQLSHPYMTTGKTITLTTWSFVSKVMSLLFNMLSRKMCHYGLS